MSYNISAISGNAFSYLFCNRLDLEDPLPDNKNYPQNMEILLLNLAFKYLLLHNYILLELYNCILHISVVKNRFLLLQHIQNVEIFVISI